MFKQGFQPQLEGLKITYDRFNRSIDIKISCMLQYKCTQPCSRTNKGCTQNHLCTKKCFEECGDCKMMVWKVLPACGHKSNMPCSKDTSLEKCKEKCERTMQCGHKCKKICYEKCGNCNVAVIKKIPFCGHEVSFF